MDISIHNLSGEIVSKVRLSDSVFKIKPNDDVIFRAIMSENTNSRQGTNSTKTRSEVSGGGKKPWKQKGRGAARAGTIRSPLWKGGGTIFGPECHTYKHKISKKMSTLSRKSVLTSKASEDALVVVDNFDLNSDKTSDFFSILKDLKLEKKKITLLIDGENLNLDRATRNLSNIYMVGVKNVSTYELVDCEVLLIDKNSFQILANMLNE